jgi:hypothetical protein
LKEIYFSILTTQTIIKNYIHPRQNTSVEFECYPSQGEVTVEKKRKANFFIFSWVMQLDQELRNKCSHGKSERGKVRGQWGSS